MRKSSNRLVAMLFETIVAAEEGPYYTRRVYAIEGMTGTWRRVAVGSEMAKSQDAKTCYFDGDSLILVPWRPCNKELAEARFKMVYPGEARPNNSDDDDGAPRLSLTRAQIHSVRKTFDELLERPTGLGAEEATVVGTFSDAGGEAEEREASGPTIIDDPIVPATESGDVPVVEEAINDMRARRPAIGTTMMHQRNFADAILNQPIPGDDDADGLSIEEAQNEYDSAEPEPISEERVNEIVEYATGGGRRDAREGPQDGDQGDAEGRDDSEAARESEAAVSESEGLPGADDATGLEGLLGGDEESTRKPAADTLFPDPPGEPGDSLPTHTRHRKPARRRRQAE